jgi:hypothetical protein
MINKYYLFSFYILFCFSVKGQTKSVNKLILYTSSNKNTTLIFSSPIKDGIIGNPNFGFGYNKVGHGKIGFLKGTPGDDSNLFVVTENGNMFSFTIIYKKEIEVENYFINDSLAIGNEINDISKDIDSETIIKANVDSSVVKAITVNDYEQKKVLDSSPEWQTIAESELKKDKFFNRIYGSKYRIMIELKNIVYVDNYLFITIIFKNDSPLDYDIKSLDFFIDSKKKKKNATAQVLPYKYKYQYNLQSRIKRDESFEAVFVYDKFSINENKILLIEMDEQNGERSVYLEIPNSLINNPN